MVENELPISTLQSPADTASGGMMMSTPLANSSSVVTISIGKDCVDDDDDNIENLSNRNNLSGSYSNLFRDKLDDDDVNAIDANVAYDHSAKDNNMMLCNLEINQLNENVYSNIPNVVTADNATSASSEKSDPNLHVYSNISTPSSVVGPTTAKITSAVQSTLNEMLQFSGVDASMLLDETTNSKMLAGDMSVSSTLLNDDLDLDDPVTVAGTFGQTPKMINTNNKFNEKSKSLLTNSKSETTNFSTSASKMSKSISLEMKNVIPQVALEPTTTVINHNNSSVHHNSSGSVVTNNSNAFCSPSRMRLLHDTTMIDTALDLDSLDGSSLGNNSQACLVKTAIV